LLIKQLTHAIVEPMEGPHLLLQSRPAEYARIVLEFLHQGVATRD
jgi:hypothetical protein